MNKLTVEASLDKLETVTEFVEQQLENFDCPMKAMTQFSIAIDEVFSNIALYAYPSGTGPVTIIAEKEPSSISLCFVDEGTAYDPLKKEDPDISLSAEEREIGGLGIFMVKKIMDDVSYERKDGCNILTIKKNI